jgi:hypothetical protein
LQFSNGNRFFASGHGEYQGVHMIHDHKIYGDLWDHVLVPSTQEQENEIQQAASRLIGLPFDWRGLIGFVLPFIGQNRNARYCSSLILEVLQNSLHMFPGVGLKVSPNGLYRLFLSSPQVAPRPVPAHRTAVPAA